MKCPCGSIDLDEKRYSDEHGLYEKYIKCNTCGEDVYHWSMGRVFVDRTQNEKMRIV